MVRLLLPSAAALAACTPSPQENAMPSRNPEPATATPGSTAARPDGDGSAAANRRGRAASGPVPEPVSVAEKPLPPAPADSPAEAQGRRTLSTAFVRVGPDGGLTVELRDGRVRVLRNVVMRRKDYCGVDVSGGKFCGGYGDVAAARPGGGPLPAEPGPAVSEPAESPPGPANGK